MGNYCEQERLTMRDINLAINYTIIERTMRCMGIYDNICNEHEFLGKIIEEARNGTLNRLMAEKTDESSETQEFKDFEPFDETLINTLSNLTGLSEDIITGKDQFKLRIKIDPSNEMALALGQARINYFEGGLSSLVDQFAEKLNIKYDDEKEDSKGDESHYFNYWDNPFDAKELNQSIGRIIGRQTLIGTVSKSVLTTLRNIILYNPCGINSSGLFAAIYLENKAETLKVSNGNVKEVQERIQADAVKNMNNTNNEAARLKLYEDVIDDYELVWHYMFRSVANRKTSNSCDGRAQVYWKPNVYDLDHIIYSILHKDNYSLEGDKNNSSTKFKSMEKISDYAPYPLVIYQDSDLLKLIEHLKTLGYAFSMREIDSIDLIEVASIDSEIERYEKEKKELEERKKKGFDVADRLELVNNKIDILWAEKISFTVDPAGWTESYLSSYKAQVEPEEPAAQVEPADPEKKVNKTRDAKHNSIVHGINFIERHGKAKKPKQYVFLSEPYSMRFKIEDGRVNNSRKKKETTVAD